MQCQVEVLEKEVEGDIVKCRCKHLTDQPQDGAMFAFIKASLPLSTDVGSCITVCSPWKVMKLSTSSASVLFVFSAHN